MQGDWLDTVVAMVKDAPVVGGAALAYKGFDLAPVLNGVILVAFAVWAVARAVGIVMELVWKVKDRHGKSN